MLARVLGLDSVRGDNAVNASTTGQQTPNAVLGSVGSITTTIYRDLQRIAHRQLMGEAAPSSLQTKGLVHEAYLRLAAYTDTGWDSREHFLAIAAQAMRRLLVDRARRRRALKRSGRLARVPLSAVSLDVSEPDRFLDLNDALDRLETLDPRRAGIVALRFFVGLDVAEIAAHLEVSEATVKREWRAAKAWLLRALNDGPGTL